MKFSHRLGGWIIYGTIRGIAALPLPVSQAIGSVIGRVGIFFNTRSARVTRTNLDVCFPEMPAAERDRLALDSMRHTGRMMMEMPAAWLGAKRRILAWITAVDNMEQVESAIAAGDGVVIILPHIGNWELINAFLSEHEKHEEFVGLYAPPRQDYLKKLMSEVRLRFGNELVPTTVKGIGTLLRRLREGKLIVVLPDQVPATGQFAPFFGVDALTDVLITRMLQKCPEARAFTCTVERLDRARGFHIHFDPADPEIHSNDQASALAAMNRSIEATVHRAPAQYQWEYKRFKERPAGQFRLYNYKGESSTRH